MLKDLVRLNHLMNPYYPFFCLYPALYEREMIYGEKECALSTFILQLKLPKRETLAVLTNKRLILYKLGDGFWKRKAKSLVSFGVDELIGAIPGVGDLHGAYGDIKGLFDKRKKVTDKKVEAEMDRILSTVTVDEEALLANNEGYKIMWEVPLSNFARGMSKLELTKDKVTIKWNSSSDPDYPLAMVSRNPKILAEYSMTALWALAVYFKAELEKFGLEIYSDGDEGMVIQPKDGSEPLLLDDFLEEDPLLLFKQDKALPDLSSNAWVFNGNVEPEKFSGLSPDYILETVNNLFPKDMVYQFMDKGWLGKKKYNHVPLRPGFLVDKNDISNDHRNLISAKLKQANIPFNEILVAHNAHVIEDFQSGLVLTDTGLAYWDNIHEMEFLPWEKITSEEILSGFDNPIGITLHVFFKKDVANEESGVIIEDMVYPHYFREVLANLIIDFATKAQFGDNVINLAAFTPMEEVPPTIQGILEEKEWCNSVSTVFSTSIEFEVVNVHLAQVLDTEGQELWVWLIHGEVPTACINAIAVPEPQNALGVYLIGLDQHLQALDNGGTGSKLMPMDNWPEKHDIPKIQKTQRFIRRHLYPVF